jgi:D-glycerate 3-kinase
MPHTGDVRAYAEAGPAFAAVTALGPIDWIAWQRAATRLEADLDDAPDLAARIHHLCLPVLFFGLARRRALRDARPLMVGLQAPQGAGKTTLVGHLERCLADVGVRATSVSIDDFYLTRDEQVALAAAHPGNPYLEHRGYPGTHDVGLGEATLARLGSIGAGQSIRLPVFDKSRHGGRGDRLPKSEWRSVTGALDIVFVEGWMLGFMPVSREDLHDPWLVPPNEALADYVRWHRRLDTFVRLRAVDPAFVLRWRVEAEEAMRASGRPALDRAAIEDYISRFLPAYRTWGEGPPAVPGTLEIRIDAMRRPVG